MDFNDRLKSLQRFQDTLNKVSGTKAETLSVRIQELSKYLDREAEWVESKQGAVDKRRLKQINKNIKKAVKQFNVNLSQLLTDSNKPLTHDAWRAANKEFPELAGISALIESHHGLGVKVTADQVIGFTAPQWVEYNDRLESGLIQRKVKLRPGNVDPNAKGILKQFHQGGVHLLDDALTPKPASTIAGMADATVEAAVTSEEVLDKFTINPSGKILTSPELASVGAPQNAAAIEAIRQNPELAKNPEAFKNLLENTEFTPEGVNKLVSDLDLPSNIIEEVPLTSRLQSVFDFSKASATLIKNPYFKKGLMVAGAIPILGTSVGAATVEMQAAARDEEIAANPNDPTLQVNKTLDQISGWGDRTSLAGMAASATGAGAVAGIPMVAAGEGVSLIASGASMVLDFGRFITNELNRGPQQIRGRSGAKRAQEELEDPLATILSTTR